MHRLRRVRVHLPTGALHYEDIDGQRIMKELHTSVRLLPCRACGRDFATEKQIARVKERLNLSEEAAGTCPTCRARAFRGTVEQVLRQNGKGEVRTRGKDLAGVSLVRTSNLPNHEELR